ncbi:hypothetical protein BGZ70_004938 [Mortierella alpina]|uniref:Uncharacterized protein n=1 Tax=Mortierella alpina TaxID=64518 RepID=A0A9P6J9E9_MORAP|nr:hypothetical protein BGZ70_004938 [Mortierella alpina]
MVSNKIRRSRIKLPIPTPKISIEEAWPEFLEADKTRDLDEVKPALAKLCEAYLGGEWQAVEKKLRDEKCNTYLLAMEDTLSFGYTLVNLKYQPDQRYRVIPSFIKPGSVKKGRMAIGMARNYEENFARLLATTVALRNIAPALALNPARCSPAGTATAKAIWLATALSRQRP